MDIVIIYAHGHELVFPKLPNLLSRYPLLIILSTVLITASASANNALLNFTWAQTNNGICADDSESPFSSNSFLEKLRDKYCKQYLKSAEKDDKIKAQFSEDENKKSDNLEKAEDRIQKKLQELKDRLEKILSEEDEEQQPLPTEEQKKVEEEDQFAIKEHKSENDKDCRDGNVLAGASNEEDLKVLAECQEAAGEVVHTKKMDDGDYKFLLDVEDKYKYLLNEKNDDKTDGFLVVEIVPPDQDSKDIVLPDSGDKVHVWGAWVTDKPKGWHEIHPAWKVVKE
jgi:dGTP triphosphohydrolase